MHSSSTLVVAAAALVAIACSRQREGDDAGASRPPSHAAASDTLDTGEVRIVSADSGVDLALLRDTISGGLSQQTLATVRHSVDTATVTGRGLGASIEKLVKSSVSSAVGTRVAVPLSAVKEVRYEGGKLHFEWNGKPVTLFENAKVNGKPVLESFRPDDARRFVDVVRARKRALDQR
jgi:hypothetical protein